MADSHARSRPAPGTPTPFVWTPDSVARFWETARRTPLGDSDFAKTAGRKLPEMMDRLIARPGARVLDFGCGSPALAKGLAALGHTVHGFEPSLPPEEAEEGEGWTMSGTVPADTFDAVIVSEVYEHILEEELDAAADGWASLLRPGGRLIVTTPHAENLQGNLCLCPACDTLFHRWQHVRSVTLEELETRFGDGKDWRRVHAGKYDFSNMCGKLSDLKRYGRNRDRLGELLGDTLGREVAAMGLDGAPDAAQVASLADALAARVVSIIEEGPIMDAGFDHSEGRGHILVYVAERLPA